MDMKLFSAPLRLRERTAFQNKSAPSGAL